MANLTYAAGMKQLCIVLLLILSVLASAGAAPTRKRSLYQRLGGAYAISALVDDFLDKLLKDPIIVQNPKVVAAMGNINVPGLKFHITNFVCAAAGGPEVYTGRDMAKSHKHLSITQAEWDASVAILKQSLKDFDIKGPEGDEVLALVGSLQGQIVGK